MTLFLPRAETISFTGNEQQDAFALAVGYELDDRCPGLSGYVVTVRWDPAVLRLRTDYQSGMTDEQMLHCTGCYFSDLYGDGLTVAESGTYVVNYRDAANGVLKIASVGAADKTERRATLFVLDFAPLGNCGETEVTVSVDEQAGLASASGPIGDYQKQTSLTFRIGAQSRPDSVYGDADGNQTVNEQDAELIRRYATGACRLTDEEFLQADVNGDGLVNAVDYLLVKQQLTA